MSKIIAMILDRFEELVRSNERSQTQMTAARDELNDERAVRIKLQRGVDVSVEKVERLRAALSNASHRLAAMDDFIKAFQDEVLPSQIGTTFFDEWTKRIEGLKRIESESAS